MFSERLLCEGNLYSPEMQKMMDLIAEVINSKPALAGHEASGSWMKCFFFMLELGFRRLRDTNEPADKAYFEWLYDEFNS